MCPGVGIVGIPPCPPLHFQELPVERWFGTSESRAFPKCGHSLVHISNHRLSAVLRDRTLACGSPVQMSPSVPWPFNYGVQSWALSSHGSSALTIRISPGGWDRETFKWHTSHEVSLNSWPALTSTSANVAFILKAGCFPLSFLLLLLLFTVFSSSSSIFSNVNIHSKKTKQELIGPNPGRNEELQRNLCSTQAPS